ncbi:hypothetical protein D3C87_1112070 [compost metagenome]
MTGSACALADAAAGVKATVPPEPPGSLVPAIEAMTPIMSSKRAAGPTVLAPICNSPRVRPAIGMGAPACLPNAMAWSTSLIISGSAKSLDGRPSSNAGNAFWEMRLRPVLWLIASVIACSDNPILQPMATTSSVASRQAAFITLLTALMAWPSPRRSPQRTTVGLMACRIGSTFS